MFAKFPMDISKTEGLFSSRIYIQSDGRGDEHVLIDLARHADHLYI